MMFIEIKDKTGRIIYITKERWKHIVRSHPILGDKIWEIKNTLEKPLLITKGDNENTRYYYRYYKYIQQKERFLIVVVKYLNGKGFILTSFYVDRVIGIK